MKVQRYLDIVNKSVVPGASIRHGVPLRYLPFNANVFEISLFIMAGVVDRFGENIPVLSDRGARLYYKFSDDKSFFRIKASNINFFAFITSDKICYVNFT